MRVLIVGAGAVGSLLGHRLAAAGHAVTLISRAPWVEAIRKQGLGLEEEGKVCFQKNLTAVTDIRVASSETFDLIACTTKAYDTVEALGQVAQVVPGDAPLLILQNGVGGEELAREVLPQVPCLAGVITLAVEVLSPGLIRLATRRGGVGLADVSPGASVDDLVATLRQAGFERVRAYADYCAIKWSKLLLNILANALPAILDVTPAELYAQRQLFDLERAAFCEALAVMRGLGLKPVSLPGYLVPLLAWGMARLPGAALHPLFRRLVIGGRGGKMPSLYLDLIKGKPKSEVDFLNGAIVDHARSVGLSAPVNQVLHRTLKAMVTGEIPSPEFRGQPRKLLALVGWCA